MYSEGIIFIPGFGCPACTGWPLAWDFQKKGYETLCVGYSVRQTSLEIIGKTILPEIIHFRKKMKKVHWFGYSTGGVLLRIIPKEIILSSSGRVVMVSPPNRGSLIANRAAACTFTRRWFGPLVSELSTHSDSLVNQLGPVQFEVGVIAGSQPYPGLSKVMPLPHDGMRGRAHKSCEYESINTGAAHTCGTSVKPNCG